LVEDEADRVHGRQRTVGPHHPSVATARKQIKALIAIEFAGADQDGRVIDVDEMCHESP